MLPKNKVVKPFRCAVEKLYSGKCTVIEHKPKVLQNHSMGFEDVILYENEPCRLSFQTMNTTQKSGAAREIKQVTKLFTASELKIKAGCKIIVTQNNVSIEYKSSGEPARYETHQEIMLEPFERWS